MMAAYEFVLFACSAIAEHKAKQITELLATLKLGYTTKDSAVALFQAHRWNVKVYSNACSTPKGSCEGLFVDASNYPQRIPINIGSLGDIVLLPLPPVRPTSFGVYLYFIDGTLNSINESFHVGATGIGSSRNSENQAGTIFRSSEWRYANEGMVAGISALSTGSISDVPAPKFAFKYMYSLKCVDARMLWPSAPPPTLELRSWPGCR